MRKRSKKLGSLAGTTLGDGADPNRATADAVSQTYALNDLLRVVLDELNPISIAGAAASGFATGLASSAPASSDNVNTTSDGSGSISISDFKNVGGTCKPMNFPALNFAKALQSQMNRVAQVKGWGKIGVDGAIGPGTMALFAKIKAAFPQTVMGDTSSCSYIAADADVLTEQVRQVADGLNAPAMVAAAPSGAASIVTKSGKVVMAPVGSGVGVAAIDGALGGMSDGQKVVFVGLLGGIGYVLYKKSHKKGRKRS